jgi:Predicted ribosomal protein
MIKIEITETSVICDGHACYAEKGKDIVCEAITALFQTLDQSLEVLTNDHFTTFMKSGHTELVNEHPSKEGKLLMDAFSLGAEMISSAFPDYVRVSKH